MADSLVLTEFSHCMKCYRAGSPELCGGIKGAAGEWLCQGCLDKQVRDYIVNPNVLAALLYHRRPHQYTQDYLTALKTKDNPKVVKSDVPALTRRQQRVKTLPFRFSRKEWRYALHYFEDRCAYCSYLPLHGKRLHKDHFIPLISSGCPGTVAWNIVPACERCNTTKHDKDVYKWVRTNFGEKRAKQILAKINTYFDIVRERAA